MSTAVRYTAVPGIPGIVLPRSKSESNRALLIAALAGEPPQMSQLSQARDTLLMQQCLEKVKKNKGRSAVLDVEDAGTVARFIVAFCAVTEGEWTLNGSSRMSERPQGPLIEALRHLGADIRCTGKEGFFPLQVNGKELKGGSVEIDSTRSSQFISALMLIAPVMKKGLELRFQGEPVSRPYIDLTAAIMKHAGAKVQITNDAVSIKPGDYKDGHIEIGSDWSAASFFYAFTAITGQAVVLKDLDLASPQGDSFCERIFRYFGVRTKQKGRDCHLSRENLSFGHKPLTLNLVHYPDLAPNIIVCSLLCGMDIRFTGLETLALKESDRVQVLSKGLGKHGYTLQQEEGSWHWSGDWKGGNKDQLDVAGDHRMAMAFALLALKGEDIRLSDMECVGKSFPGFWEEINKLGLE